MQLREGEMEQELNRKTMGFILATEILDLLTQIRQFCGRCVQLRLKEEFVEFAHIALHGTGNNQASLAAVSAGVFVKGIALGIYQLIILHLGRHLQNIRQIKAGGNAREHFVNQIQQLAHAGRLQLLRHLGQHLALAGPITRTSFRIETDKSPRNYPISRAFFTRRN